MARARQSERTLKYSEGAAPESPWLQGGEREVLTGKSQLGSDTSSPELVAVEGGVNVGACRNAQCATLSPAQRTWEVLPPGGNSESPLAL